MSFMLAEMDQRTFDSLPDAELWLVCSEPAVRRIRAGTSGERARMLSGLGAGERALFGFRLLYPAFRSEADFEAWTIYLLEQPGYWKNAVDGLRFFEESGLTTLLEETKRCLEAKGLHLEFGGEYRLRLRQLFERFQNGFAAGSERVSGSIRFDPASFVRITA